mgnify:CR=1 FL=1
MGNTVGSRSALSLNETAYIAGFLDGDGSISARIGKYPNSWSGFRVRIVVTFAQKTGNQKLLKQIKSELGLGRKIANYRTNGMSELVVSDRAEVKRLLETVNPFLKLKKPQAKLALRVISLLNDKRGNKNAISRNNFRKILKLSRRLRQLNAGTGHKENTRLDKIINDLTP